MPIVLVPYTNSKGNNSFHQTNVRGPANRETPLILIRQQNKRIEKEYETIFPNWMGTITIAEMQEAIQLHKNAEWAKHEAAQLAKRIERQTQSDQLLTKTN
jgi:hypothetical protein